MIVARSHGCDHIGWVETDVLRHAGLIFHPLLPNPLSEKKVRREAGE